MAQGMTMELEWSRIRNWQRHGSLSELNIGDLVELLCVRLRAVGKEHGRLTGKDQFYTIGYVAALTQDEVMLSNIHPDYAKNVLFGHTERTYKDERISEILRIRYRYDASEDVKPRTTQVRESATG